MTPELRSAIEELHRRKDTIYGVAWKKRGEVFSIIPNIARKVDRVEATIASGQNASPDGETVLDTAVDLLVYCLKYKAFLSDIDGAIAARTFPGASVPRPYSEGPRGLEYLLQRANRASAFSHSERLSLAAMICERFAAIERCFSGAREAATPTARLEAVEGLIDAAVQWIQLLEVEESGAVRKFITENSLADQ